jgi:hypothetical protein
LLEVLSDEHPYLRKYLSTLNFKPNQSGVFTNLKRTAEYLKDIRYDDFDWVIANDPKLTPIYQYTRYLSGFISKMWATHWLKIHNKLEVGGGEIGALRIIHDSYIGVSQKSPAWSDPGEPFGPLIAAFTRDTTAEVATTTPAINLETSMFSFDHNEVQPGIKYTLRFTVVMNEYDSHFSYGDEDNKYQFPVTWAALANGLPAIKVYNYNTRHQHQVSVAWPRFSADILVEDITFPTHVTPIDVTWGPDGAFTSTGFIFEMGVRFPVDWTEEDINPDGPYFAPKPYVLGRRPYKNWWGQKAHSRHPYEAGPLHSDLLFVLERGFTIEWDELATPAGVSFAGITQNMTLHDLENRMDALETAAEALGAHPENYNALTSSLDDWEGYLSNGLMLIEILTAVGGAGTLAGIGAVLKDAFQAIIGVIGSAREIVTHPVVGKLAGLLTAKSTSSELMMIFSDISNTGFESEAITYVANEIKEIAALRDLPEHVIPTDAVPHGIYFVQSLALGGPLGRLAQGIGALLTKSNNMVYTRKLLLETTHIIPLHASTVAYFPNFLNEESITDKFGNTIDAYVRRITFSEFGSSIGGESAGEVSNGIGFLRHLIGTQYWSVNTHQWLWVKGPVSTYYSGFTGISDGMAYEDLFIKMHTFFIEPERERSSALEYTPIVNFESFSEFIQRYKQLAGNYNLFSFNCQDMATEIMKYLRETSYPDWWTPRDIHFDMFDRVKVQNASHGTPAFSTAQIEEMETALKTLSARTTAFGLGS